MKIAIVTDDLIQRGGQEKVVAAVSDIWPTAPIYTTQASAYWQNFYKSRGVKVVTSFMQDIPYGQKLNRYFFPTLFHMLAFESFDFSDFDVVLSISSRFAHFITSKPSTLHICYMNSPGRMFWEPFDYFGNESFGKLSAIKKLANPFFASVFVVFP